jgi:hypothetical protein
MNEEKISLYQRIIWYLFGPEIPWVYRVLLFLFIAMIVTGYVLDNRSYHVNFTEGIQQQSLSALSDDQTVISAYQKEMFELNKKKYERLIASSNFMFDLAKISFGILVGGLSALIKVEPKQQ